MSYGVLTNHDLGDLMIHVNNENLSIVSVMHAYGKFHAIVQPKNVWGREVVMDKDGMAGTMYH